MKRVIRIVVLFNVFGSTCALGELQNIDVGGKIEIYGAWYSQFFEPSGASIRIPDFFLPRRPIGPDGTTSAIRAGHGGNDISFFEQRTRVHALADFTNSVMALVEFDSIDTWGEDFRSDYVTGRDFRANTSDDVELYQAVIDVHEPFGWPISLHIGRQELEFGSGWLVGADPGPDPFVGLSFDGVRLTWSHDPFTVDAWWSKLAQGSPAEQDGDVDFYGIYASLSEKGGDQAAGAAAVGRMLFPMHLIYSGIRGTGLFRGRNVHDNEEMTFDVYWMFVRDARSQNDTNFSAPLEWVENVLKLDNYNVTQLHTVGARGAGKVGPLDWELEAAYQFGEADAMGVLFKPNGGIYGDDGASWNSWAGHGEFGYTLPTKFSPRIYTGGAYYGGEDNRGVGLAQWLNPLKKPQASISFNRLFSSWREDALIDSSNMTNFWKAFVGASAAISDAVTVNGTVSYYQTLKAFDQPVAVTFGDFKVPVAPALSFWTTKGATDLGWQTSLWCTYNYTDELSFEVGWTHFFTGDGLEDGAFIDSNGLDFVGGIGKDDVDYLYFLTTIQF